jgi:hypothetical protein
VADSDDRNVMVEVAPGVKVKMLRQAIATVVPDSEPDGVAHTMSAMDDAAPGPDQAGSGFDGSDASSRPDQRSDLSR